MISSKHTYIHQNPNTTSLSLRKVENMTVVVAEQWRQEAEEGAEAMLNEILLQVPLYQPTTLHLGETEPDLILFGSSNDCTVIDIDTTRDFSKLPSFSHACQSYASDDDNMIRITESELGLQRLPSFGDVRSYDMYDDMDARHAPQLLGCLSCFSFFINLQGNMCFNPFDIFQKKPDSSITLASPSTEEDPKTEVHENEILKRTVYRGLVVVIASLSVVAFAAASNASTLSIILLALACIFIGVFIFGYNDWRLRDDCYSDNYFMLQAFLAILSFLVLGMIPPVAYGLSFHETNDKDFTLMVVVVTSLLCVSLLAMIKAYIKKCTVFQYFKTIVYYITVTVSVSSVSYIAGILLTKLIEEFKSSSGTLPHAITSSLASF